MSQSLHDLIYSQTLSALDGGDGHQKDSGSHHESEAAQQEHYDFDPLDAFYQQQQDESAAVQVKQQLQQDDDPAKQPVSSSQTSSTTRKRRRRRRGGKPTKSGLLTKQEEEEQWETASQAEQRKRKRLENREWQKIRHRWKRKKYNLTTEVDYGGAVQHVAQVVHEQQKKKQKQHAAATKEDTTQPIHRQQDEIYVDSSDEERQEYLGSLLTPVEESASQVIIPDSARSQPEQLDYWTRGYMAPAQPDFTYGSMVAAATTDAEKQGELVLQATKKKGDEPAQQDAEETDVVVGNIHKAQPFRREGRYYFSLQHPPTECPTHGVFFHQRNLICMASRFLVGTAAGGSDESSSTITQNRLIRALHHKSQRNAHRIMLLLQQARDRAMDLELFYSHRWKDPSVVRNELWGSSTQKQRYECELMGSPPHSLGYTLRALNVASDGRNARKRLVNSMSCGKVVVPKVSTMNRDDSNVKKEDGGFDMEKDGDEPFGKEAGASAENIVPVLPPTTDYVHVPGTTPPIPSFPLDENSIVLGPPDKHAWISHTSDVDAVTYSLTMSVLLGRLGIARQQKDDLAVRKAHDQIMSYAEQTMKHICSDRSKLRWMKDHDVPVAPLCIAVMGYCSYVANSGSFDCSAHLGADDMVSKDREHGDWSDSDEDERSSRSPEADSDLPSVATMDIRARLVYDHCERFKTDKRLAPFPRVHVTLGVAVMVKNLPQAAADILSRACDLEQHRTPFDLMRMMLEYLEDKKLLVDTNVMYAGEESVNVGELEHAFHEAANIFKRCVNLDPAEATHHMWYMSALAGSLLLCSGNAIGCGARRRPSSKKPDSGYRITPSQDHAVGSSRHEVRQVLPKFHDLRKLTADSVVALIKMARDQQGSRLHLAVSSFLEWKEVIALLVGSPSPRSSMDDDHCKWAQARRLHAYHTIQWAAKENSVSCLHRVDELRSRDEATVDAMSAVIAGMLENDPRNKENWRRLAFALGPIGQKVPKSQQDQCKQRRCKLCKRLRRGLNIDHDALRDRKEILGWWGEGRMAWWETQILKLPPWTKPASQENSDCVYRVSTAIEKSLVDQLGGETDVFVAANEVSSRALSGVGIASAQGMDLSWLQFPNHLDDDLGSESDEDDGNPEGQAINGDEQLTYDSELPKTCSEVLEKAAPFDHRKPSQLLPQLSSTPSGQDLEALCFKVLLTCHLYDVVHPTVRNGIWFLAKQVWQNKQSEESSEDSDEWRSLRWLSAMGLNVPRILHDVYKGTQEKENEAGRSSKRVFSPEQKNAIRLGVKRFGTNWVKIQRNYDVLMKHTNVQIKHCYRWMAKKGEIQPVRKHESKATDVCLKLKPTGP